MNLDTGSVYALNETAARIVAWLSQGERASVIEQALVDEFPISAQQAGDDVANLLELLHSPPPIQIPAPLQFVADGGSRVMYWKGTPLLQVDQPATVCRWIANSGCSRSEAKNWILLALPHLLIERGYFVLHASAVRLSDGVHAFIGASGSGKSTCARLLCQEGAERISNDLLWLGRGATAPVVSAGAEKALYQWADERARALSAKGQSATELDHLLEALPASGDPLQRIVFLNSLDRRTTDALALRALSKVECFSLLIRNAFAEMRSKEGWTAVFGHSRALAALTPAVKAILPLGLDRLGVALRSYSTNSAS